MFHYKLTVLLISTLMAIAASAQDNFPVETVVQKGHAGKVNVMKFSKDGRFMVTGSDDQSIKLWDINSGREIRTFKGHQEPIEDVDIDVENGFIVSSASSSIGSEIKVWDLHTGQPKKTVKGGEPLNLFNMDAMEWAFNIRTLAIGPDGKTLLWGEDNLGIQIGTITKRRGKNKIETDWEPNSIVFSPDGKYFASGGDEINHRIDGRSNEVRIFNFPELSPHKTLKTENDNINKLIYSNDGRFLACLNTQIVWESNPINSVGVPLTKKKYSNRVSVFDLTNDQLVFEVEKMGWEIKEFAFSPNGQFLAIPYSSFDTLSVAKVNFLENEKIYIYDVTNRSIKDSINTREFRIHSIGFTPDNQTLIGNGQNINYWSAATWKLIKKISPPSKIEDLQFLKDGTIVTSRIIDGKTIHFTLNPNNLNFTSKEIDPYSFSLHSSENEIIIATDNQVISKSLDGLIDPFILIKPVEGWDKINRFELSSDGKLLVCTEENKKEILVKDLDADSPPIFLKGHRKKVTSIKISPDGKMLASGSDGNKIILWDLVTGQEIHQFLGHNGDVIALDFNSAGTILASGSEDRSVKIWDLKKKQRIETFLGHSSDILTLDFNEDGSQLVSGSGDKMFGGKSELIIWDIKRKKKLRSIIGNEGYVSKTIFRGDVIYSIGYDPILKAYDSNSGNDLFSYIPLGLNDFIIFSPDNYYTSTKMKYPAVHFVKGVNIFSFDNFDLQYNRPDIILERVGSKDDNLKGAYNTIYNRRLKKLGFNEAMLSNEFELPEASILEKNLIPLMSDKSEISLAVDLKDEFNTLDRLMVTINNIPVYGSKGLKISNEVLPYGKKGTYINKSINVKLNNGFNKIQVSCFNNRGVESHKDGLEIIHSGSDQKPNLYLLVLGVSEYQDEGMNLQYAAKDGRDMLNFLTEREQMYDKVIVDTLFNQGVTKTNFDKLKNRLYTSNVNDHVILFMAGHGLLDEDFNFNFASYTIDPDQPQIDGISFDQIESIMDGIPARKKLILIDACHSGEVDKQEIEEIAQEELKRLDIDGEMTSQSFKKLQMNVFKFYGVNSSSIEMMEALFTNISRGSGAVVISAAAGNSYALESDEWNNGVFTYCIMEGLQNNTADLNGNGNITVTELKDYVVDRVYTLTNGRQKPTSRKENLEFDFQVWK